MLEREGGDRWCGRGDVKPSPKQPQGASAPLTPLRSHCPGLPGDTRGGDTRHSPEASRCSEHDCRTTGSRMGIWGCSPSSASMPQAGEQWPRGSTHPRSCASRNSPSTNRQLPTTEAKFWGRKKEGEIVTRKKFISLPSLAGLRPAAAEDGTAGSRGWKRRC